MEFMLPPPECTTRDTQEVLAAWALFGYMPAVIMLIVFAAYVFACIVVACALCEDAIEDVSRNLGLRVGTLSDDAWKKKIHDPMVSLARVTIPLLDQLQHPIGAIILGSTFSGEYIYVIRILQFALILCPFMTYLFPGVGIVGGFTQIPLAVATGNRYNVSVIGMGIVSPIVLAGPIASLGTSCDDLLEKLNELLVEGDDNGNRRVMPLQRYLLNMNRRQGLGVRLFGVVIDRRYLATIASTLVSLGSTLAVALFEFGQVNDKTEQIATSLDTVPLCRRSAVASACSMNSTQLSELWQGMATILTPVEGMNTTCSYELFEELALPAFGLGP